MKIKRIRDKHMNAPQRATLLEKCHGVNYIMQNDISSVMEGPFSILSWIQRKYLYL